MKGALIIDDATGERLVAELALELANGVEAAVALADSGDIVAARAALSSLAADVRFQPMVGVRENGNVKLVEHPVIAAYAQQLANASRFGEANFSVPLNGRRYLTTAELTRYAAGPMIREVGGLRIVIENAKGSLRSGYDSNGVRWEVRMPADYGYVTAVDEAANASFEESKHPRGEHGKFATKEERAAALEELNRVKEQIRPLAEKGGLTRSEAETYKRLSSHAHALRFDLARTANLETLKLKPPQESLSTLSPQVVVTARNELMADRNIYNAVMSAVEGVSHNADTALDDIVLGRNPAVSFAQLYGAFSGTRAALATQYGSQLKLYRAEGQQKPKPTTNWATTREFARQFGSDVVEKTVPIENILLVNVGLVGSYHEVVLVDRLPEFANSAGEGSHPHAGRPGHVGGSAPHGQVNTEAFAKWFKNSKIVDSSGNPKVMFHGTTEDFDKFDIKATGRSIDSGWFGYGAYFSSNPKHASGYALYGADSGQTSGANVKPVYLSIRNPFVVNLNAKEAARGGEGVMQREMAKLGIIESHLADEEWDSRQLSNRLKNRGYDGVIVNYPTGDQEVTAFFSNQVKSAIGNRGTFDPNDENISNAFVPTQTGADGDGVDCWLGEANSEEVHVIDQRDLKTGKFDEHKCFVNFPNRQAALATYLNAYSDGQAHKRIMGVRTFSLPAFKQWLQTAKTKKRASRKNMIVAANSVSDLAHHDSVREHVENIYRGELSDAMLEAQARISEAQKRKRNLDDAIADFAVLLNAALMNAAERSYKSSLGGLASHIDGLSAGADATSFAAQRAPKLANAVSKVTSTVSDSIRRGIAAGESEQAIARRIAEGFRAAKPELDLIAETETQVVYGSTIDKALRLSGYTKKRWVTMEDERVRHSHELCSEQGAIPINTPFVNGLRFPGDPNGAPAEVINCRCYLEGHW